VVPEKKLSVKKPKECIKRMGRFLSKNLFDSPWTSASGSSITCEMVKPLAHIDLRSSTPSRGKKRARKPDGENGWAGRENPFPGCSSVMGRGGS